MAGPSRELRYIDTYRMVAVYPSIVNRSLVVGEPTSRDLVIWRSTGFPSYRQLVEIGDDDERESIIKDLVNRYGYTHAWDPRADSEEAFYELESDGDLATEPDDDLVLEEDDLLSEGARLTYAGARLAATENAGERKRAAMLSAEPHETWKPDGFEVKVGGASGSRKIWLHTVVEAPSQGGRRTAVHAATTIAHARDF